MVRLSTTYEKVYDDETGKETSQKFFILRGDEAYARTTVCELATSNYVDNEIDYYTVDVGIDVHRGIGTSHVHLFMNDDDSPIHTWNASSNVTHFTKTGVKLPYGYENLLYAVYEGNAQCLKSKSKTAVLDYGIPPNFQTNFNIICDTSINSGATLDYSVALSIGSSSSSPALYDRPISIYVDGLYYDTITTPSNSNVATGTVDGMENGVHKITFEVEKASSINQGSAEVIVNVGCHVDIIEYPSLFIQYESNTVKVEVTNYIDEPIVGATVSLMDSSQTTDSDGIATFTFTTVTNGRYSATCNGTSSEYITVSDSNIYRKIYLSSITTSTGDGTVAYDDTQTITFDINQNVPNIPIILSQGIEDTVYTNEYGKAEAEYTGKGVGKAYIYYDMPAKYCSHSEIFNPLLSITDYLCHWRNGEGYKGINYDIITPIKEYNSYFEFPMTSANNTLYIHDADNSFHFPMRTEIHVASACSNIVMTVVMNGYKITSNPFSVNNGDTIVCYRDESKSVPPSSPWGQFYITGGRESVTTTSENNSISFKHSDSTQEPLRFKEMYIYKWRGSLF